MNFLITGGASGLGLALTKQMASIESNKVYFTYHESVSFAMELQKSHDNVFPIVCDFANSAHIHSLQERIPALSIDVLVNNAYAGTFIDNYFHKTDLKSYQEAFVLNIVPVIAISQTMITYFRKQKKGKIFTILTTALTETPPLGSSVYLANKAYLAELARVWAFENKKFNISSNTVSPSFMETRFTQSIDERIIEQIKELSFAKEFLTPVDAAAKVYEIIAAYPEETGIEYSIDKAGITKRLFA